MGTIFKEVVDSSTHLIGSSAYGKCTTAAGTVAKVVTMTNFDLTLGSDWNGITIHVYMQYTNTATNPTLNVNSKGAKPIYKYGTTVPGTTPQTSWQAGSIVSFTYNTDITSTGCWVMNDHLDDTDTIITSSDITFPNITVTTTGSGNAFTAASASGHALTFTKGTTFSTTDTKNTAGATTSTSKMYLIGATATGANPQTYCNTSVYATNGTLHATNLEGAGTNITGLVETGTTAISSYTGSALIYILKDSSGNVTDIYVKQ